MSSEGDHSNHGAHMGHGDHMNQGMSTTNSVGDEAASKIIGDHSHYVYTQGGHGDGVLQAGVDEVLLFTGAVTSSSGSLLLACIVLLLSAVVLEYLRLLAWWLESRYVKCSGGRRDENDALTTCNRGNKTYGTKPDTESELVNPNKIWCWVVLGLLHCIIYVWGTCLMLITMTFNIFIIFSIGTGVAVGKLATMYTRTKLVSKP